ncbi:pantoate--beta-alanine ligase [Caulobacter sp. KR2-114]|uniref:pantoate--beta-alanine ligase n=1 Tax=Caulobacter sp. KR2-114 TaxID=3400912 RepID=UPI003C028589
MTDLPTVRTKADLRARVAAWRAAGERVALVPTMGALHEGHLSLVGIGRQRADRVVATLFVNPTQFSPAEDFEAYPRDEGRDAGLLAAAGCDLLYAPSAEEMYPPGFATSVAVAHVSEGMEGAARPHHFGGVATVVTKLLTQAAPDVAVFGEKDYQQLQVIRRLARDLDLPVEIVGGPTVRAEDGLALSSRNAYLTPEQRAIAPALNRALRACAQAVARGSAVDVAEAAAIDSVLEAGFDSVDYLEVRSAEYLERLGPGPIDSPARILTAARLGRTRLLDNVAI